MAFFKSSIVLLVCLMVHSSLGANSIYYKLSANNLPNMDGTGDMSDPFAEIYLSGTRIGRTDTIMDDHNPEWPNVFEVVHTNDEEYLNIEVRDHDPIVTDDHIGWAYVYLRDMNKIGSITSMIAGDGQIRGSLTVKTVGIETERGLVWDESEIALKEQALKSVSNKRILADAILAKN